MAFCPYWQLYSNKLAIFIISCIVYLMLFVEDKFFFFLLSLIATYLRFRPIQVEIVRNARFRTGHRPSHGYGTISRK